MLTRSALIAFTKFGKFQFRALAGVNNVNYEKRQYAFHPSLKKVGIENPCVYRNMSVAELVEHALDPYTNWTNDPKGSPA